MLLDNPLWSRKQVQDWNWDLQKTSYCVILTKVAKVRPPYYFEIEIKRVLLDWGLISKETSSYLIRGVSRDLTPIIVVDKCKIVSSDSFFSKLIRYLERCTTASVPKMDFRSGRQKATVIQSYSRNDIAASFEMSFWWIEVFFFSYCRLEGLTSK